MATITITVVNTQKNINIKHQTAASSWGELKKELSKDIEKIESLKGIGRLKDGGKISFELDENVLPKEDFTLFFFIKNTKAGDRNSLIILETIKECAELLRKGGLLVESSSIEELEKEL